MKAFRIARTGGPEVMRLEEIPVPEPGEGEVRLRMEACGLNYSDIMMREGFYLRETPLPLTLGHEVCGVIEKLGPGVEGWAVGQRVLVATGEGGGLAEHVVVPAGKPVACPEELTPPEGAALLVQGLTALLMIDNAAKVQPGETVLVHAAAGGVGTLAIQIARSRGARVLGTSSTEKKRRLVADLGATPIDYTRDDWTQKVIDLTGGKGADVILEMVGGRILVRSYREALADFGRLVVYGVASGEVVSFDNREILASNKALIGFWLGPHFARHLERVVAAREKLMQMIRGGELRLIVGKTFPLEEAADAFAYLQGRNSVGKVVVTA